jgi:hypothetical protein
VDCSKNLGLGQIDSFSTIYLLLKLFSFKNILNTMYNMISWRAGHLNGKSCSREAVKFKRLYAKSSSRNNKTTPMLLKMFQTTQGSMKGPLRCHMNKLSNDKLTAVLLYQYSQPYIVTLPFLKVT